MNTSKCKLDSTFPYLTPSGFKGAYRPYGVYKLGGLLFIQESKKTFQSSG
jgi:hypothetical protein